MGIMTDQKVIIYGTNWCGDCIRVRRLLRGKGIAFEWIDIDRNRDAEQFVLQVNQGMRSVPTLVLDDGSILVEPSNIDLVERLKELLT